MDLQPTSMTSLKNLPVVGKMLNGRKFLVNFGFLPGFDNIMTFISFQEFENELIKDSDEINVRRTSDLVRRQRH
jgi:hypothetical protein